MNAPARPRPQRRQAVRREQLSDEVAARLRQRGEAVDRLRAGGGRDELELRVRVDYLERLAADRSRRAEECDSLHAAPIPRRK